MTILLGPPETTAALATRWATDHGATDQFVGLAPMYWAAYTGGGVRPEVAYAQAAKETGFGHFGGTDPVFSVDPSYHNFCGLKTTDGQASARFADDRTGVEAHYQHLCLYAGAAGYPVINPVDPRHFPFLFGKAPSIEALGGQWAPDTGYGVSVVTDYLNPMLSEVPIVVGVPQPLQLDTQGRIVGPNVSQASPFPTPNGNQGFHEPAYGMASHTEVGYEHNVLAEFENPGAQASAFCSVSGGFAATSPPDGHITQYGPIGKGWMAWTQAAGNPHWRGVEHEDGGDPNHPYTDAQVASSAQLLELFSLVDGFSIQPTDDPTNGRGNIFHSDGGAAWGGHDCPGNVRRAQRPAVVALAQQIRAIRGGGSPTTQGDDDMPKAYICEDPETGGTWAVLADDGEVDAVDGAPYLGGQNNHPEWHAMDASHPVVGIAPWKDTEGKWGYKIGEYDPNPPPGQGRVRYYRFNRDGRYAK